MTSLVSQAALDVAVTSGALLQKSLSLCFRPLILSVVLTEASASFRIPRTMRVYGRRRRADGGVMAPSAACYENETKRMQRDTRTSPTKTHSATSFIAFLFKSQTLIQINTLKNAAV